LWKKIYGLKERERKRNGKEKEGFEEQRECERIESVG
jgi:hypothetical protein